MDIKTIKSTLQRYGLLNDFYKSLIDQYNKRGLSDKQYPYFERIIKTYDNLKEILKITRPNIYTEDDIKKSKENYDKLKNICKNKIVAIGCHYDADGVSSGALLYNLIKKLNPKEIIFTSSDEKFTISKKQFQKNADIYIITDINPGDDIPSNKLIYIDHHPLQTKLDGEIMWNLSDESQKSASILLFKSFLLWAHEDLYDYEMETFFMLTGYIGDMGDPIYDLDDILYDSIQNVLPYLLEYTEYNSKISLYLEKFRSYFNLGKRSGWDGNLILNDLIKFENYKTLKNYFFNDDKFVIIREELKELYSKEYNTIDSNKIIFAQLNVDEYYNIVGVIASRLANNNNKTAIAIQKKNGVYKGSMRSDEIDCNKFVNECPIIEGAGHSKAAGFEIEEEKINSFIEYIKKF